MTKRWQNKKFVGEFVANGRGDWGIPSSNNFVSFSACLTLFYGHAVIFELLFQVTIWTDAVRWGGGAYVNIRNAVTRYIVVGQIHLPVWRISSPSSRLRMKSVAKDLVESVVRRRRWRKLVFGIIQIGMGSSWYFFGGIRLLYLPFLFFVFFIEDERNFPTVIFAISTW